MQRLKTRPIRGRLFYALKPREASREKRRSDEGFEVRDGGACGGRHRLAARGGVFSAYADEVSTAPAANVWQVGSNDELNQAVAAIEQQRDNAGLKEATIALTADIELECLNPSDGDSTYTGDNYFAGIEGVTVTLTSAGKAEGEKGYNLKNLGLRVGTTFDNGRTGFPGDYKARFLAGSIVFDQVNLVLGEEEWFFAQGNKTVFTEKFTNSGSVNGPWSSRYALNIVGGTLGTKIRQMGTGFEQGQGTGLNSAGGKAAYKSFPQKNTYDPNLSVFVPAAAYACDGTEIEIHGGCFGYVIGGSYNGYVMGNTNVTVALDPSKTNGYNNIHNVQNVFGGSMFMYTEYGKQPSEGKADAFIWGDTHVNVLSGCIGNVYGGNSAHFGQNVNDNMGTVRGNTNVVVGQDAGMEARFGNVYGGGLRSTIGEEVRLQEFNGVQKGARWFGGKTNVTLNTTAVGILSGDDVVSEVFGAGDMDLVNGTTNVTINGGNNIYRVFASGSNTDYEKTCRLTNEASDADGVKPSVAASITINGGTIDRVYSCCCTFSGSQSANSEQPIGGAVKVVMNGGKVSYFGMSGTMTHIKGDSTLDINGGTLGNYATAISGYWLTDKSGNTLQAGKVDGKRILNLNNNEVMKCWQIYAVDQINAKNKAMFLARGKSDTGALLSCGNVDIAEGATLGLTGTNNISGDFSIAKGGTLALNGKDNIIATPGCVNADGKADGTAGTLLVMEPSAGSANAYVSVEMLDGKPVVGTPVEGDVYLRCGGTTSETAQPEKDAALIDLDSSQAASGLYVEYTQKQEALNGKAHAWRIAQGEVVTAPWYYEVYYQQPNGQFARLGDMRQGDAALPTAEVSINAAMFDGKPLGNGVEGTFGAEYVFDASNASNRLTAKASEATADNPLKIYYKCAPHTVTYEYSGDAPDGAPTVPGPFDSFYSAPMTVAEAPAYDGYTFSGWSVKTPEGLTIGEDGAFTMPNADVQLVGTWTKNAGPVVPPVDPPATTVTLHYESNGGTEFADETYSVGAKVDLKRPLKEGAEFGGWYLDEALTQPAPDPLMMDANKTVWAQWKAAEIPSGLTHDHVNYIVGRALPEGYRIVPEANITRAEAAMIFFRLLTDDVRTANLATASSLPDVPEGMWYTTAVATLEKMGIVKGDGQTRMFRLDDPIKRAELAAMAARFDEEVSSGVPAFADLEGHWASDIVTVAAQHGWVLGYPDGLFHPDAYITRAETMAVINRVLQRLPESEADLLPNRVVWPDNADTSQWYWLVVEEATNNHDHALKADGMHESWTALNENIDWRTLY